MTSKPVQITKVPTLVERKSKQTALNDKAEPMSLPINDLSYSKYQPMIICENLKLCILQKTTYLAFEQSGHLIFNRSLTDHMCLVRQSNPYIL